MSYNMTQAFKSLYHDKIRGRFSKKKRHKKKYNKAYENSAQMSLKKYIQGFATY